MSRERKTKNNFTKGRQERLWLDDISKIEERGFQCMSLFRIIHPHVKIPPGSLGVLPAGEGSQPPGRHRHESRFLKSAERQAHRLCQLHPRVAPLKGDACSGRRVKCLQAQVTPKNSAAGLALHPPASKSPSALKGPAEAGPCPLMGPSPTVTQVQGAPKHQAAPRGQTSTGGAVVGRSWSKGLKLQLCEQSKSVVCNTASNAGDVLDFRTPATEMVTVLTISLLMCASDHHA